MFGLVGTGMRKNIQFFVFLTVFVAPCFVYADTTTTSKQYVDNNFVSNVAMGNTPGTINVTKAGTTTSLTLTMQNMGGASASANGSAGLVPAPSTGDQAKFLRGDGTWATANTNVVTTNNGTDGYVVNSVTNDTNNPSQINVTRSYVKIPIATGAPSTNTPTGFVEIWFQ